MLNPFLSVLGLVPILIASPAFPSAAACKSVTPCQVSSSPTETLKATGKKHHKNSNPTEDLEPGQAITRRIWKDTRFVFEGKAGEVVTLKVTAKTPGIDPHVTLLDPDHIKEAFDDDSGGHGNSLIQDHALKQSGRYTVVVGLAGSDAGEVEILLEKAEPPARSISK